MTSCENVEKMPGWIKADNRTYSATAVKPNGTSLNLTAEGPSGDPI
jgi:hypothetical protein